MKGASLASIALAFGLLVSPAHSLEERKVVERNNITINTQNKVRYIVRKNEQEGVKDLRRILETSPFEETFVFFPGKKLWRETSHRERADIVQVRGLDCYIVNSGVGEEISEILKAFKVSDNLVFYHPHPTNKVLLEYINKKYDFSKMPYKLCKNHSSTNKQENLKYVLPSIADVQGMYLIAGRFYKIHPQGNITFKVISKYGVMEYKLTDKGRKYLIEEGKNKELTKTALWLSRNTFRNHLVPYFRMVRQMYAPPSPNAKENRTKIDQMVSQINANTEHFTLKFVPFKE